MVRSIARRSFALRPSLFIAVSVPRDRGGRPLRSLVGDEALAVFRVARRVDGFDGDQVHAFLEREGQAERAIGGDGGLLAFRLDLWVALPFTLDLDDGRR